MDRKDYEYMQHLIEAAKRQRCSVANAVRLRVLFHWCSGVTGRHYAVY